MSSSTESSMINIFSFILLALIALLNEDYSGVRQQILTFGPSVLVICTPFFILNDDLLESTEYITLSLSASKEDIAIVNISVSQSIIEILEDSIDGMHKPKLILINLSCDIEFQLLHLS